MVPVIVSCHVLLDKGWKLDCFTGECNVVFCLSEYKWSAVKFGLVPAISEPAVSAESEVYQDLASVGQRP